MKGKHLILAGARLYRIWRGMKNRCTNKNEPAYVDYGGRGLSVCARWQVFDTFAEDVWESYTNHCAKHDGDTTLERINNNLGYSPKNCSWATRTEQADNKRSTKRLTAYGKTQTLSKWAKSVGMTPQQLWNRVYGHGWGVERALETPFIRKA